MARKPIRVSQLNSYLAKVIAADSVLSDVSVIGEISNFKTHGSGHVYFSLIDESSRVDCFLGSGLYRGLGIGLRDGIEVVAEGYVNVYEKGGRYSLTIRRITESGQGDLSLDFEKLKKKLSEKGYFDEGRKKALPSFPRVIAVVTSGTGAAVSDMKKIITSRNSVADILIFPTLVQGDGAAEMIAARIRQVNASYPEADVIITGRGGGSSEDLSAFNHEAVADAIFESVIPVISAVGHETDFTIADFVADRRAETPTAAAVLACPDTGELAEDVDSLFSRMKGGVRRLTAGFELRVRANNMEALVGSLKSGTAGRGIHLKALRSQMRSSARVKTDKEVRLKALRSQMQSSARRKLEKADYNITGQSEKLEALNPLNVLLRGYAIVEDKDGRAVSSVKALKQGDEAKLKFSDGCADAAIGDIVLGGILDE